MEERLRSPLPIDAVLPEIVAALRAGPAVVLQAPPGTGKTTRVPPALLAAGLAGPRRIVVLEPRRIAARAAARRIAAERGWEAGREVGWQVRFERRYGPETRLLVVTEGILTRMLQGDPFLEDVGVVVFDEFHERSLHTDLALAMTRRVQADGARPDLKIVVMSATLDAGPVAAFLGGCPVVTGEAPVHPLTIRHADRPDARPTPVVVAEAVRRGLADGEGDVLAFLPGVGEIRRTAGLLAATAVAADVDVLPLYGDLPPASQDAALRAGPRRRVVLATNVAESSVTVAGVRIVVDSGLARVLRHDPTSGLDRLMLGRIGRASADQRAGRAAREGPGLCLRLWPASEHAGLRPAEEPEVRRVDLAGAALELRAWGEPDPAAFAWFEAPHPEILASADLLLRRLGAVDDAGITPLGRTLVTLPVHPRLGRLLVEAWRLGHPNAGALAAALLAERDPFRPAPDDAPPPSSDSDVLDRVHAVEAGRDARPGGALRQVERARAQLAHLVRDALGPPPAPSVDRDEAVLRAVFAGWSDRLARRRAPESDRGVLLGGSGVRLAPQSAVRAAPLFVCVDVDAGRRGVHAEALVRLASAVPREWLPEGRVTRGIEVAFDPALERVVAVRRTRFDDLALDERIEGAPDPAAAAQALAAAAAERLGEALDLDEPAVAGLLARVRSLAAWRPDLGLPTFDDDALRALLPALAAGRRALAELRAAPLADALLAALTYEQRRALDREAPARIDVPSGRSALLRYEPGAPPVLAVPIQELFGCVETPRVAGGRVPVRLHLLAPNGRPQQVTDDLAGFWERGYPEVRKELRGRYPKHPWPEDPRSAPPTRPGQRRRR